MMQKLLKQREALDEQIKLAKQAGEVKAKQAALAEKNKAKAMAIITKAFDKFPGALADLAVLAAEVNKTMAAIAASQKQ